LGEKVKPENDSLQQKMVFPVRNLQNIPIFATLNYYCPDGEIGRRTVFRSQRSQGCAGSNPVLGTNAFHDSGGHFYLAALSACNQKQTNENAPNRHSGMERL
jgi:hypothetical protein